MFLNRKGINVGGIEIYYQNDEGERNKEIIHNVMKDQSTESKIFNAMFLQYFKELKEKSLILDYDYMLNQVEKISFIKNGQTQEKIVRENKLKVRARATPFIYGKNKTSDEELFHAMFDSLKHGLEAQENIGLKPRECFLFLRGTKFYDIANYENFNRNYGVAVYYGIYNGEYKLTQEQDVIKNLEITMKEWSIK